jgi:AcrR family transcriptional regulator
VTATAQQGGYHHGDLRNALILAAAALIEERGSLDFAMAEAARRAGVSSAAPYRHFRDKDALLQAVAQLCFIGLSEASRAAVAGREPGDVETIIALGHAYIRFMLTHSSFQDLMWGDLGKRAMDDDNVDLRGSGFYVLADCVAAWCRKESISRVDAVEVTAELWAMVHGLSGLAMSGQVGRFVTDADVFQLLERSTHIFFDGLRCRGDR